MRRTRKNYDSDCFGFMLSHMDRPLLTQAQEIELSRKVREAVILDENGHEQFDYKNATPETLKAFEAMATQNLRLVVSIAKDYQNNRGAQIEELIQEGNIGLMRAIAKFDPEKGYKFSTYATWWIKQSMMRFLGNSSRVIRLPIHQTERLREIRKVTDQLKREGKNPTIQAIADRAGIDPDQVRFCLESAQTTLSLDKTYTSPDGSQSPLSDIISDEHNYSEDWATAEDRSALVEDLLSSLPTKQQQLLRLRYGLNGGDPKTLKRVGEIMGITRERVRQIEMMARNTIINKARKMGVNIHDYLEESA